jgi:hypothetical protein
MPNYKNAFKCKKCPKSNKEDGCPAWNEIIMTNSQTGEQRIEAGCFYQILPALLVESIRSSAVATNTQASVKNEIARGFATMARAMPGFVEAIAETVGDGDENEVKVEVLTAEVED